jgi:putative ABC transport system permease protein
MTATIFAVKQLTYMQSRDPGFNRDQVVTIPLEGITYRKFDVVKQQLLNNTLVTAVTGSQDVLGSHLDQSGMSSGAVGLSVAHVYQVNVDHDYLNLFKFRCVGRNFSPEPAENGKNILLMKRSQKSC